MKRFLTLAVVLLLASGVKAQYFEIPFFTGPMTFGTFTITVTATGSTLSGGGDVCIGPTTDQYWVGETGIGTYTYALSRPIYGFEVHCWGINGGSLDAGEYMNMFLNGSPYSLVPADVTSFTECMGGGGPCYLSTGYFMGPVGSTSVYNGGDIFKNLNTGITSFGVSSDGILSGVAYVVLIDTTFPFRAANNGPCVNDTLKLNMIGDSTGATYLWSGPLGFTSTLKNPFIYPSVFIDAGVYTGIRTIAGASDTSSTFVTIHPKPIVTVTSNAPLCQGMVDTLHLSVMPDSSGETFAWSGPSGFSSTLEFPFINGFLPPDVGTYTVIATSSFGCKDTGTTDVILSPVPPTPVITGVTSYCQNDAFIPFVVTGTTGTILWYNAAVGGVGSTTAPVVNTAVPGSYTYWASQTVAGCEGRRGSITVIVHPTPLAPAVTGTLVYCQFEGPFIPLAVGTAINAVALWYTTPAGGTGSLTEPVVNVNTTGSGSYSYNFWVSQLDTVDGCESPRTLTTIVVNPKPIQPVVVDIPDNYCPGQPFVPFTVVSGTGILWYPTAVGNVGVPVAPGINTIHPGSDTVWVSQTVLGCTSDTIPYVVTVYDSVAASFSFQIKNGCKADTVFLNNTSTGTSNYSWHFGDVSPVSTVADPTHVYLLQGNYTITLYASSANCIDSAKQPVTLAHPLQAQFSADTNLICQGKTITFTDASIATGPTYLWNFGDGGSSIATNPSHFYPHTGVYKVFEVVTDYIPCRDTAFTTISVDSTSPINIAITDPVLCAGTYLTFTASYSTIGNTGIAWDFGNGETMKNTNPVSYAFLSAGTFTVTAAATYRVCDDTSATRTITILPEPTIYLGPDTTICKGGEAITLADKINGAKSNATWLWNTGATSSAITVIQPGDYSATVKINGCTATSGVKVSNDCYMNIPNVFSPNGDGVNDYFYPRDELTSGLISFSMNIYNRWGQLIFSTASLDGRGWDGRLNNIDQPEGVYVYVIDGVFKDGQKEHHQGNITLIR